MNTALLYQLLEFEPYFILLSLYLLAWVFYKVFLREVSDERHKNIQMHLTNIFRHFVFMSVLFLIYVILQQATADSHFSKIIPYLALATLSMGMMVLVKTCRLIILQYLFLGSMKHGVPVLIVNIFSLLMSMIFSLWGARAIFNLELTPILATSAAFSVVLGLAMQDTLGNLFAGISLQVDRAYDIGDWIEVTSGIQKLVGQVKEITWRATTLVGWSDETIIVPNRFIAGAQISNYSLTELPIIRSQNFKIRYGEDLSKARTILVDAIRTVPGVRDWPEPCILINDLTESWANLKLVYYIDSFGSQFSVLDRVSSAALEAMMKNNIQMAPPLLSVEMSTSREAISDLKV